MSKLKNSDYIKLNQVPALLLELTGQTRTLATVYNWAEYGRPIDEGRIFLKVSKRLGVLYTTREWVLKFIQEIG